MKRLLVFLLTLCPMIFFAQNITWSIDGTLHSLSRTYIYADGYNPTGIRTYAGNNITLTVNHGTGYAEGFLHDSRRIVRGNESFPETTSREQLVCGVEDDVFENIGIEEVNIDTVPCLDVYLEMYSDYEMYQLFGEDLETRNIALINDILVDWENDFVVPINLLIAGQTIFTTAEEDPFYSSDSTYYSMYDILGAFNSYVGLNPNSNTHTLFTAKPFSTSAVGIAYVNTVCYQSYRTNVVRNYSYERVILSHEIGHNMGLRHDSLVTNRIMRPYIGPLSGFSEQSQFTMEDLIVNNYHWCILCESDEPLPIVLEYFTAEKKGKNISVKWGTLEEIDVDHYLVQITQDFNSWVGPGPVNPKKKPGKYSVNFPTNNLFGVVYLRLKVVNLDGTVEYSDIISLDLEVSKGTVKEILANEDGETVKIYTYLGQLVLKSSETQIDVDRLPSGIYIVVSENKKEYLVK